MVTPATWLATFYADADRTATASTLHPFLADARRIEGQIGIVVEVTHKPDGEWLVVFAALRPAGGDGQEQLTAIIAFSNSSARCDHFNRDGLPAFEAEFVHDKTSDRLSITIRAFSAETDAALVTAQATPETFHIIGLPIDATTDLAYEPRKPIKVVLRFEQTLASPSPVDPGGTIQVMRSGRQVQGQFDVPSVRPTVSIVVPALRYPDLSPLDAVPKDQPAYHVWSGSWTKVPPVTPGAPSSTRPTVAANSSYSARPAKAARTSLPYVPVSFRFEDVEWLGFRIDLRDTGAATGDIDELLQAMLRTLNGPPGSPPTGKPMFEAASTRINIDLLRYGRMKLDRPWGKLSADNYFSQHELVLRVAVRRVDDLFGGATAVHVPAIFVDNPWSRHLGREALGFDKRMVAVYDDGGRLLRDDGCHAVPVAAPTATPTVALSQVRHVVLRDRAPPLQPDAGLQLLGLDYSADLDRASFIDVADDRLLTPSTLASFGWHANAVVDRDEAAFASAFRVQRLSGFRGVQAAPVDTRPLERAIVDSRVVFRGLRLAFPDGLATLSLGAPAGAPAAWRDLRGFLDRHGGAEITLPAGDWYNIRCDMQLEVLDPLGW